MRNFFEGAFGAAITLGMLGFALFSLATGWVGIEHHYGWGWGVTAFVLAILFRFTIPITYGIFLCATEIWHWHWAAALVLALPGLVFMIPGLIAAAFGAFNSR